jgi:hypothetical protein
MLGLIRMLTYSPYTIDSLLLLYFNLDVNWDMTRLFGMSRILMPQGSNACSGSFNRFLRHPIFLKIMLVHLNF